MNLPVTWKYPREHREWVMKQMAVTGADVLKEVRRCSKMHFERITIDPGLMNGQPCIRNMRLTVQRVVELAALFPNREDLRREYPELDDEDIRQALLYTAAHLDDHVVELPIALT
jgi:uncharacterized protein (DUF433 family)